jgi:hypothetical protein
MLIADKSHQPIENPHIPSYLQGKEGQYRSNHARH